MKVTGRAADPLTPSGRKVTEVVIPSTSLAPSGWGPAGRRLRAARLGENPDPAEVAGLLLAFACDRAPLRERRTGRVDLAPGTVAVYQREARRFATWAAVEGVNLLRVTGDDLKNYAKARIHSGDRAQTVRRAVTLARMVSQALLWTRLDVTLPTAPKVADPVRPEDKRTPAPWADFAGRAGVMVKDSIASNDPASLRLAAALLLCGASGLRASEALGLTWADLDADRGTVRVLGKGGRERLSPVTHEALDVLARLRSFRGYHGPDSKEIGAPKPTQRNPRDGKDGSQKGTEETAPILAGPGGRSLSRQSLWKIIGRWERANGLPQGVHVLRHGAATRLASLHGLEAARDLLGHASTRTTERYSKRAAADILRSRVTVAMSLEG